MQFPNLIGILLFFYHPTCFFLNCINEKQFSPLNLLTLDMQFKVIKLTSSMYMVSVDENQKKQQIKITSQLD